MELGPRDDEPRIIGASLHGSLTDPEARLSRASGLYTLFEAPPLLCCCCCCDTSVCSTLETSPQDERGCAPRIRMWRIQREKERERGREEKRKTGGEMREHDENNMDTTAEEDCLICLTS